MRWGCLQWGPLSKRWYRVIGPSSCGCGTPHSRPPPLRWWDQARKSIPASPSATKSNHTSTPLTALSISLVLLVLLPPAIPHHSNNSPSSPFYTTPSHHLPPPQHISARLPFPPAHPIPHSNNSQASLATLLTHFSVVLLPPAIPHHSNNSPLSPLYTTPSNHFPPPQHISTRLPFPPAHPIPHSNNSQASLATLLTHFRVVLLPPAIPHHSNNSPLSPLYTTPSHHLPPPQYSSTRLPFPPAHPIPHSNNSQASLGNTSHPLQGGSFAASHSSPFKQLTPQPPLHHPQQPSPSPPAHQHATTFPPSTPYPPF